MVRVLRCRIPLLLVCVIVSVSACAASATGSEGSAGLSSAGGSAGHTAVAGSRQAPLSSDVNLGGPVEGAVEGSGFASSDATASALLSALARGDIAGAVRCFAVETYVDGYWLAGSIDRLGGYGPGSLMLPPIDGGKVLDIYLRAGQVASEVNTVYLSLARSTDMPLAACSPEAI